MDNKRRWESNACWPSVASAKSRPRASAPYLGTISSLITKSDQRKGRLCMDECNLLGPERHCYQSLPRSEHAFKPSITLPGVPKSVLHPLSVCGRAYVDASKRTSAAICGTTAGSFPIAHRQLHHRVWPNTLGEHATLINCPPPLPYGSVHQPEPFKSSHCFAGK